MDKKYKTIAEVFEGSNRENVIVRELWLSDWWHFIYFTMIFRSFIFWWLRHNFPWYSWQHCHDIYWARRWQYVDRSSTPCLFQFTSWRCLSSYLWPLGFRFLASWVSPQEPRYWERQWRRSCSRYRCCGFSSLLEHRCPWCISTYYKQYLSSIHDVHKLTLMCSIVISMNLTVLSKYFLLNFLNTSLATFSNSSLVTK